MPTTTMPKSKAPAIAINPCSSSQLHGFGFCPVAGKIAVQFRNAKGPTNTYLYPGTQEMYDEFTAAESKGRFFGERLKGLDAIKVVDDEPEAA